MSTTYRLPEKLKEAEEFLRKCEKSGQDDYTIVTQLQAIADMCAGTGVESERVCMKTEEGKVTVTERFPAVAVSALAQITRMKENAIKLLEKAEETDPVINVIIQESRLEDILG